MKKQRKGLLYVMPWILGFLIFTTYPFVTSLVLSFTKYDIISSPKFIGFANYVRMFTEDQDFWKSLTATFKYVFLTVPLKLAFALFIAFILNFKLKGISFYRTAYYVPSILGANVAIAVLWRFLFSTSGLVNQVLSLFGADPINWFGSPGPAMFTLTLLKVWEFGSSMVIFLAALKEIPEELYDAAAVDGANPFVTFTRVTIPLLTPVIFFNFVMQLIHAFQEFNGPYLITGGGPLKSTYLFPVLIYDHSFKYFNMGYASALSWVLFVIIMAFTVVVFKSSKYWVFYSDTGGK
ncbi:MAG: carbohydrate ABC transporter permease [Bacillota bacterium]